MPKSVKLNRSSMFTPSAYSKHVSLWCENVGLERLVTLKSELSVNTKPDSSPSKIENCQK